MATPAVVAREIFYESPRPKNQQAAKRTHFPKRGRRADDRKPITIDLPSIFVEILELSAEYRRLMGHGPVRGDHGRLYDANELLADLTCTYLITACERVLGMSPGAYQSARRRGEVFQWREQRDGDGKLLLPKLVAIRGGGVQ